MRSPLQNYAHVNELRKDESSPLANAYRVAVCQAVLKKRVSASLMARAMEMRHIMQTYEHRVVLIEYPGQC